MKSRRERPIARAAGAVGAAILLALPGLLRPPHRSHNLGLLGEAGATIGILGLSFVIGLPAALVAPRYVDRGGMFTQVLVFFGLFFVTLTWCFMLSAPAGREVLFDVAPLLILPGLVLWLWLAIAPIVRARRLDGEDDTSNAHRFT